MNRRNFISSTVEEILPVEEQRASSPSVSKFANKSLPKLERTSAGLEPYGGTWGNEQVAHLLRRTMFGAKKADIDAVAAMTLDDVVAVLLADLTDPAPPLSTSSADTDAPPGTTWVNAATNNFNVARRNSLKSWWTGLILDQPISLREKMTLFWHNHFVTETTVVGDARFAYRYNTLLRQSATGNFKELTKAITINGAMLRYLNGNTSTKTSPNENYSRELQELFTIGKGPEIAPGNYTNYTEADVITAARALTGWRDSSATLSGYFTSSRHDTTNKQFSSAYGNTIVNGQVTDGSLEIDDLLTMIFAQPETANFICRKLYRWFVYYVIDEAAEANVIVPLANVFRSNNYEMKPVLSALLKSAHFFDSINMGCVIKSPVDVAVGMCRQFGVTFPTSTEFSKQYTMWKYIWEQASAMQMELGDPPNVAGWPAYYQIPQFYELWINSDTLPKRNQFTDTMITAGHTASGFKLVADPIAFALQFSDPSDPVVLIDESAQVLFPIEPTAAQKVFLKGVLLPGLPDYEWTIEWNDYLGDPTNAGKQTAVKTKLQELFGFMMSMAEYQLA